MSVLGRIQPDMIVDALHKNYEENELNVNRVVECGQDAQVLDKLLSSPSLPLALDVAAVASKRDLVDLESWVIDGIEKHGADFVHAALDFLDRKVNAESSGPETQADTVPLTPPVYATFFRALRNSDILNADDIGHFKEIRNMCLQIHPRLMNLNPEANTEPGLAVVAFPPEVDAQVDDFYQRMYAEEISLDHVIEVFQRLKKSDSRQDRQLFACMLHTLFDEYKFVQTYPPRELAMTGLLFGSIIQYHLVESTPLHVAVRYVLDALQSPPDSTMFSFGKNALNIFQSRLPEFPLMCRALLEIPHLHESNPVLMSIIRTALTERGMDGDEGGSRPGSPDRVVFPGLQVVDLDQEEPDNELILPEERTSDQILFIVNNLAPTNFDEKANDLKRLIVARYSRWFAEYLVNARISVEPNNHGLYMQLIETLSLAILEKHVLWETYRKSAQLLNSEKTLDNSQDKVVLKNIASWLGKLTVARDLPVKHRQLSLKDVLVQGYDEKRLQVAIPFVCKIMEQCAKSKVFHPPNPWLMAVMGLLTELYQFAELKLNLKFEIEVLCKTLEVDLASIQPSDILRKRTPPIPPTQPARLAQELDRITMPAAGGYMGAGGVPSQAGPGEAAQQAVQDAFLRRIDELIAQLPSQLLFNPAYPMFQSTTALKRIVHLSIDRALREIINPVVERSVTIAGISSRDLLMKDFGMESDDAKLRQAAHLMVSKLAGSLALVTCKEPLRTSMLNNIRTMMLQSGFTEVGKIDNQ
jgi:CCR4-NOT transcription complex subunit 1